MIGMRGGQMFKNNDTRSPWKTDAPQPHYFVPPTNLQFSSSLYLTNRGSTHVVDCGLSIFIYSAKHKHLIGVFYLKKQTFIDF